MNRTLLVITSSPGSPEALRGLTIGCTLDDRGRNVAFALLQDAVLAAVKHNRTPGAQVMSQLLSGGAAVFVAQHDLALRGIALDDLTPGATAADDRRLVDLMLADGTQTLGCF